MLCYIRHMNNDFEVLPIGSREELIFLRLKMCELLEADDKKDHSSVRSIVQEIRDYYRKVV